MPIADLLKPAALDALATASNLRLGRQIAAEGGVEWLDSGADRLKARVGKTPSAGQTRTVELRLAAGGLQWSCTCTRRADLFCKHCVAAALATSDRS